MITNALEIQAIETPPNLFEGSSDAIWQDLADLDELAGHAADLRRAVIDHLRVAAIVEHNRQFVRSRIRETEEAVLDLRNAYHRIAANLIGLDRCQGITVPAIRAEFVSVQRFGG